MDPAPVESWESGRRPEADSADGDGLADGVPVPGAPLALGDIRGGRGHGDSRDGGSGGLYAVRVGRLSAQLAVA